MRRSSGISLMLLIFLSLCLIIFSLLSLSGATADETLSRQAADRTTDYYAAVSSANHLLAEVDAQLASCLRDASDRASYLQRCEAAVGTIDGVSWSDGLIAFSVELDEDQLLQAKLEPTWPESDSDSLYRIRTWKIINTGKWHADQHMNLLHTANQAPPSSK